MSKSTKIIAALGVVAGLGVAALPLNSFAAETGDVNLKVTVGSTISMTIDGADRSTTPLEKAVAMDNNDTDSSLTASIKVTTNDADGYILSVKDKAGDGAALKGAQAGNTQTIPAFTVKQTDLSALVTDTYGWGMMATNANSTVATAFSGGYGFVTDTDQVVVTSSSAAAEEETTITYGVVTKDDQVADTYSNLVTYTVTAR